MLFIHNANPMMALTSYIHIQYCYTYLIDQIPLGLLIYSHIPTALLALLFGAYILFKTRNLTGVLFFGICFTFSLWCAFDFVTWLGFPGSEMTMFTWSILDFISVLMFLFTYYFLHLFITKQDLPTWQKILGLLVILPTGVITLLGLNLSTYDANVCAAIENQGLTQYAYYALAFFILASAVFAVHRYKKETDALLKREVLVASVGVLIFLTFFFSAVLLVSLLADGDASLYVYNYEIYGLFGMPVFLAYFAYLIVRYRAFNLKIFGAQALVIAIIVALASEFAFAATLVDKVLVAITLILTSITGVVLIRSVKREVEQREHIEELAKELQETNERQEGLLHFIGHEVKGFLTKDAGAFAALAEGDYGQCDANMKPFVEAALKQSRDGARSVTDILLASNQKKGTMTYAKESFDLKALITEIIEKEQSMAKEKNLALSFSADDSGAPYTVSGDREKVGDNVFRNVIENSIHYTPSGSITASLKKVGDTFVFAIKDSGVGISVEDMQRLFTEGGHGKDSQRINAHSTGYGLYIAKNVTEAHGGTIRAESEGAGKGATFTVEFPAV